MICKKVSKLKELVTKGRQEKTLTWRVVEGLAEYFMDWPNRWMDGLDT